MAQVYAQAMNELDGFFLNIPRQVEVPAFY